MKIRLADYVADFLVEHGVTDAFSVVGGGAMHLNDALGHKEGLKVTYNCLLYTSPSPRDTR
mgnify:CR=1 FL=1